MNTLVKMKFGSNLYGTATKDSDTDYKGIYFPDIEECILQKIKKSIINNTKKSSKEKNSLNDIDLEIYSLQYFLDLARQGQTVAIDMLHAPDGWEEVSSFQWDFLKKNRSKFYTKNLSSLLGYAQHQAAKYGIKGSRIAILKEVLSFLRNKKEDEKLGPICLELQLFKNKEHTEITAEYFSVCSRKFQYTTKIGYVKSALQKILDNYGERAYAAEKNLGVDWKAISHAFRAAFQTKEIFETKNLIYPLKEKEFLLDLKLGKFHFLNDKIDEKLDSLIKECISLSEKSTFPINVDEFFWEKWLCSSYLERFGVEFHEKFKSYSL